MSARIWSARMGYRGDDILPVTRFIVVDPVGQRFAPSAQLLVTYLERRKTEGAEAYWETYAAAYTAEMRQSYRAHRAEWEALLARESVTLLCFCADARVCHRTVLAGILGKLGAEVMGERLAEGRAA